MAAVRLAIAAGTLFVCSVAYGAIIVAPIDGNSYTVQQIIDAGGIKIVDKTFTEWRVTTTAQGNGLAPQAGAISVTAIQISGEYGMRFNGPWSAAPGDLADTTIGFRATADDPWLMCDNSLVLAGFGADKGGLASISENVYGADPTKVLPLTSIANKYVYYVSDTNNKTTDHKEFGEDLKDIWVIKDVIVNGSTAPGATAHISEFYQTFSQIPEPSTVVLLAVGALLALVHRRRR